MSNAFVLPPQMRAAREESKVCALAGVEQQSAADAVRRRRGQCASHSPSTPSVSSSCDAQIGEARCMMQLSEDDVHRVHTAQPLRAQRMHGGKCSWIIRCGRWRAVHASRYNCSEFHHRERFDDAEGRGSGIRHPWPLPCRAVSACSDADSEGNSAATRRPARKASVLMVERSEVRQARQRCEIVVGCSCSCTRHRGNAAVTATARQLGSDLVWPAPAEAK